MPADKLWGGALQDIRFLSVNNKIARPLSRLKDGVLMEFLDNVGRNGLGDALAKSIDEGAKLSIISSYFRVFAFSELKEELEKLDSVRFLFSEPTFVKRIATDKDPRQFSISQCSRERGVGRLGLELTLRNRSRSTRHCP